MHDLIGFGLIFRGGVFLECLRLKLAAKDRLVKFHGFTSVVPKTKVWVKLWLHGFSFDPLFYRSSNDEAPSDKRSHACHLISIVWWKEKNFSYLALLQVFLGLPEKPPIVLLLWPFFPVIQNYSLLYSQADRTSCNHKELNSSTLPSSSLSR